MLENRLDSAALEDKLVVTSRVENTVGKANVEDGRTWEM